jgi:hypothetical protein
MAEDDVLEAMRNAGEAIEAPASVEQVAELERVIGCPLPRPLRRLFLEVGAGGFGDGFSITEVLAEYRRRNSPVPPDGMIVVACLGFTAHAVIDCRCALGQVWSLDGGLFFRTGLTTAQWLGYWAAEVGVRTPTARPR